MVVDLTPQMEVRKSLRKKRTRASRSQPDPNLLELLAAYPRGYPPNMSQTSAAPEKGRDIEPPHIGSLLCSKA
jgi:hypothetical protein